MLHGVQGILLRQHFPRGHGKPSRTVQKTQRCRCRTSRSFQRKLERDVEQGDSREIDYRGSRFDNGKIVELAIFLGEAGGEP